MNVTCFDKDLLELKDFAARIEKFLLVEQQFVQGGLVVALSARFGAGKTTFLRMWKAQIEKQSPSDRNFIAITLNAWESDYLGDPLLAIISDLTEQLSTAPSKKVDKLVECAKQFGWFALGMGNQVVKSVSGIDPIAAGEFTKKRTNTKPPVDLFAMYKEKKEAMTNLKEALRECIGSSPEKVLFLVDELDRCRPDYAITYLETIKHIFDIQGAVFVLAADRKQLENVAKKSFGSNLDFNEYYRKFIHREISLPIISEKGRKSLTREYIQRYLSVEGVRSSFLNLRERSQDIVDFISQYELTPRQTQEVFRLLGHVAEASTPEKAGQLKLGWSLGAILMCTLKVGAPTLYETIGRSSLSSEDAIKLISAIPDPHTKGWWLDLLFTGGIFSTNNEDEDRKILNEARSKLGLEANEDNSQRTWQLNEAWGRLGYTKGSRFHEIYGNIENVSQWT